MLEHNNTNELAHHGVRGQKWGIRRYQNKDGSLTPAGRRKANKMKEEYTALTGKRLIRKPSKSKSSDGDIDEKKNVKDMTNAELKTKTDRLNAEKNYIDAVNNRKAVEPSQVSRGKKIVDTVIREMITPSAIDVGRQLIKSYMVKGVNEGLKLENDYKIYTNNKKKN